MEAVFFKSKRCDKIDEQTIQKYLAIKNAEM